MGQMPKPKASLPRYAGLEDKLQERGGWSRSVERLSHRNRALLKQFSAQVSSILAR